MTNKIMEVNKSLEELIQSISKMRDDIKECPVVVPKSEVIEFLELYIQKLLTISQVFKASVRGITTYQRKANKVLRAIQLRWDNWGEVCEFVPKKYFRGGVFLNKEGKTSGEYLKGSGGPFNRIGLLIETLDKNEVLVEEGNYVVLDSLGAPYPCNKNVFEENYEAV